ncbi:hypothetical protein NIES4073_54260 [Kalymmatonema gypsitolerans NIES-4073]|nr:hypothetical protein NIES4073_54260 [Scytonema sp. NIES-4073]
MAIEGENPNFVTAISTTPIAGTNQRKGSSSNNARNGRSDTLLVSHGDVQAEYCLLVCLNLF